MFENLEIDWTIEQPHYGPAVRVARVGKWKVGSVFAGIESRDYTGPRERAHCGLPGVKDDLGKYQTVDEAKARVESVVRYWFKNLTPE